jgi:methylisocitrate lyase
MNALTPGQRFREAVEQERPLQIVGTINSMCALMAERAGFRSIYLSGAGVANASHGMPDLGVTNLNDVLEDARRITATTSLPLLVDADTGWTGRLNIQRTTKEFIRAGIAALHLEDQIDIKRCGHRPGKQLVSGDEMVERLQAAVEARFDPSFVLIARTDAAAVEGLSGAIERAAKYVEAGADMIFAEALTTLDEFRQFTTAISVPVLANITEFGKTPMFTLDELRSAGVRLVLYPLTAFRAMNFAAMKTYQTVRTQGTQQSLLGEMQTRDQLYDILNYHAAEQAVEKTIQNRKQ